MCRPLSWLLALLLYSANAAAMLEVQFRPNPNPAVPNAAVLQIFSSSAVDVSVKAGDLPVRQITNHQQGDKPIAIIGLAAGQRHQVAIEIRDSASGELLQQFNRDYYAPALPTDATEFPEIISSRSANYPIESGLTLFNPRRYVAATNNGESSNNSFNRNFGLLVAVNDRGEVVWYYRTDSRISDFQLLRNGNLMYLTQDFRLVEVDMLGNIQRQFYAAQRPQGKLTTGIAVDTLTFHHSFVELENGNFLVLGSERRLIDNYYSSETDADAPRQPQWVIGDQVIEFDPDGNTVWQWNAFDHLDPFHIGYETFAGYWTRRGFADTWCWSHANKLSLTPDGNLLVNFRHLSLIAKLDRSRPNAPMLWTAGPDQPSMAGTSLTLTEGDWFWHQHSPIITERGTLLLFDNANFQAHAFKPMTAPAQTASRVVEYQIDERAGTLTQLWSSEQASEPPVSSYAMGSVQPLPRSGNILAGYGFILSEQDRQQNDWHHLQQTNAWTKAVEYTSGPTPQVAWQLQLKAKPNPLNLGWSLFGAKRVAESTLFSR